MKIVECSNCDLYVTEIDETRFIDGVERKVKCPMCRKEFDI
jgi:endogenous inhibitor of DNA gyrase (YacG/DUF329 family)